MVHVIITGASGVLGTSVWNAFKSPSDGSTHDILALSNTRMGAGLMPLDLLDDKRVAAEFEKFRPDWVIHCAAERRPDVAAKVCVLDCEQLVYV
jgi:S-adenosylmethionine synthetase